MSETNSKKNNKFKKKLEDFSDLIPESIKECKTLDKNVFDVAATFSAIQCDSNLVGNIQSTFRYVLLNRTNFKRVLSSEKIEDNKKLILLSRSVQTIDDLDNTMQEKLKSTNSELIKHTLKLSYATFTLDEILRKVLPDDTSEIVSSFETIGHIAHVNLKEHLLPYKHVIGTLIFDKNPNIKTVVNKTNNIEETFRFFQMELLAGEDNMMAKVQEHGSMFEFDYSKVYWNSRLQTEHQRIVEKLNPEDLVFDVFAGVGPFSIPAARKKCTVYANDLNKHSIDALSHNAELNKVFDSIKTSNLDGKEFLESIVIPELISSNHKVTKHIVMNLPAIAPEFLVVFWEKYRDFAIPLNVCNNIFIHCYCFSKSKTPQIDAEQIISHAIGYDVSMDSETHFVRRVAPNKVMMCVSFKLVWFETSSTKCSCNSSLKRSFEGQIDEGFSGSKAKRVADDISMNKY